MQEALFTFAKSAYCLSYNMLLIPDHTVGKASQHQIYYGKIDRVTIKEKVTADRITNWEQS